MTEPKRPPPARTKKDKAFMDLLGKLVRVPKEEAAEKMAEFHQGARTGSGAAEATSGVALALRLWCRKWSLDTI